MDKPTANAPMKLSVIMPALNEERNVQEAITDTFKAMEDFGIEGEVILVNDGSTDSTPSIVERLMQSEPRLRTINHAHAMGIGASFWDGVDMATGDIVTMFPGDNENDPWETLRYYELLEHVDMVIPFVFNKEVRSLFRNATSACFLVVMSLAMPNYSTIFPSPSRIGIARENVQPMLPSTRRTRCSSSNTLLARIAALMASMMCFWSSGKMYFCSQPRLGSAVSAMNSRPTR